MAAISLLLRVTMIPLILKTLLPLPTIHLSFPVLPLLLPIHTCLLISIHALLLIPIPFLVLYQTLTTNIPLLTHRTFQLLLPLTFLIWFLSFLPLLYLPIQYIPYLSFLPSPLYIILHAYPFHLLAT
jgi:hypothetical protein